MTWNDIWIWLDVVIRWTHLIYGISWIGSSFFFVWLDKNLTVPEPPRKGVEGNLWMVHSGGFYEVEKLLPAAGGIPKQLHWFKWPATFTWASGFLLLCVVYYSQGGVFLIDARVSDITYPQAVFLSISCLIGSWFVYDMLFSSFLGKSWLGALIAYLLLGILIYSLCHTLSGRAAFIHVGSVLGSIMVLNVWMHILPSQRQMVSATQMGKEADFELGRHAKKRSLHNSYMTLPVLFIMISNHYGQAFSHSLNWLILMFLILVGGFVRHAMITKKWRYFFVGLFFLLSGILTSSYQAQPIAAAQLPTDIEWNRVNEIVRSRCATCHSSTPTDDVFRVAPSGVMFDTEEEIRRYAMRIVERSSIQKSMPLGNKTEMTEDERLYLLAWLKTL